MGRTPYQVAGGEGAAGFGAGLHPAATTARSDRIADAVGDIDEAALGELAGRVFVVIDVTPHLQDDFVVARRGVGVFVAQVGAGVGRGDDLPVAAHFPLQPQA